MKLRMHVLDMAGCGNSGDDRCTSSGDCDSSHLDQVFLFRNVPILVLLVFLSEDFFLVGMMLSLVL